MEWLCHRILLVGAIFAFFPPVQAACNEKANLQEAFNCLHVVLRDIPEPQGVPLPDVFWRVVVASSELEALTVRDFVAQGTTNKKGEVLLSEKDRRNFYSLWTKHPGRLWFIYNSRSFRFTLQVKEGHTRIVFARESEVDARRRAEEAEHEANRLQPLPATFFIQENFDSAKFHREFSDWRTRFKGDYDALIARLRASATQIDKDAQNRIVTHESIFTKSIDPGHKGLDLRRLLMEGLFSRNRRVTAPGVVFARLLLDQRARPVGFGGTFDADGRRIELWYVIFEDVHSWSKQDFKESLIFRAFKSAELPPFKSLKRNAWPALVFVRDANGKIQLYGMSMEMGQILQSIFNAQIF